MVTTDAESAGQTPAYTRRSVAAPFRAFLRTESGSAGVLVLAILAALVWANIDLGSYEAVWRTRLARWRTPDRTRTAARTAGVPADWPRDATADVRRAA